MKNTSFKLDDEAILRLTKTAEKQLLEPGTKLSPSELEALVIIDGRSNVAQVLKRSCGVAPEVLMAAFSDLIIKGFVSIDAVPTIDAIDPGDFFSLGISSTAPTNVSEKINAKADADAEFLQRNGYCVNLARSPTGLHIQTNGHINNILIIDDDPDITKILQMYLKLEGFLTITAANRVEILAALRQAPLPDLILLDVWLPDANGFDILTKMRQHPVLKGLPVIMLTAEATREAVLKGILGGADGYITKPFQIHPLVKAVKTVLGISQDPNGKDWDYTL